ncbi:hypothetical protein B9Z55_004297 [Caenorhabditis nigoni]|uniref:Uncharacterized protein n=1 Tax=Caenorhabditis nigoni TaxID=1611254 RepID=A0A2G5UVU4_9PELO|nr:hypothetical protein B9Z55_004297 [Caenorhabditis nigoni]
MSSQRRSSARNKSNAVRFDPSPAVVIPSAKKTPKTTSAIVEEEAAPATNDSTLKTRAKLPKGTPVPTRNPVRTVRKTMQVFPDDSPMAEAESSTKKKSAPKAPETPSTAKKPRGKASEAPTAKNVDSKQQKTPARRGSKTSESPAQNTPKRRGKAAAATDSLRRENFRFFLEFFWIFSVKSVLGGRGKVPDLAMEELENDYDPRQVRYSVPSAADPNLEAEEVEDLLDDAPAAISDEKLEKMIPAASEAAESRVPAEIPEEKSLENSGKIEENLDLKAPETIFEPMDLGTEPAAEDSNLEQKGPSEDGISAKSDEKATPEVQIPSEIPAPAAPIPDAPIPVPDQVLSIALEVPHTPMDHLAEIPAPTTPKPKSRHRVVLKLPTPEKKSSQQKPRGISMRSTTPKTPQENKSKPRGKAATPYPKSLAVGAEKGKKFPCPFSWCDVRSYAQKSHLDTHIRNMHGGMVPEGSEDVETVPEEPEVVEAVKNVGGKKRKRSVPTPKPPAKRMALDLEDVDDEDVENQEMDSDDSDGIKDEQSSLEDEVFEEDEPNPYEVFPFRYVPRVEPPQTIFSVGEMARRLIPKLEAKPEFDAKNAAKEYCIACLDYQKKSCDHQDDNEIRFLAFWAQNYHQNDKKLTKDSVMADLKEIAKDWL